MLGRWHGHWIIYRNIYSSLSGRQGHVSKSIKLWILFFIVTLVKRIINIFSFIFISYDFGKLRHTTCQNVAIFLMHVISWIFSWMQGRINLDLLLLYLWIMLCFITIEVDTSSTICSNIYLLVQRLIFPTATTTDLVRFYAILALGLVVRNLLNMTLLVEILILGSIRLLLTPYITVPLTWTSQSPGNWLAIDLLISILHLLDSKDVLIPII